MLEQSILQNYLDILREELVPATGCTEPIAIAYCAATLRELLGALPERVDAAVSGNILKNVKSVVVPNTGGRKGIRAAVAAAKAAGYVGAGTVEFVLSPQGQFYFIEMNTRIQVEHPVTELVTGVDLVKEQLRVAAGLPLSFTQEDIHVNGHAIECRINAEDPEHDFRPCPGKTEFLHLPGGPGVRVDTALYPGYEVSPFYDSLVAKVLVHAPTRLEAIRRMRRSLEELVIEGYPTNSALAHLIMHDGEFVRGQYDTSFLDKNLPRLLELARTCDTLTAE